MTFRQFMGETDRRWQWWAKRLARSGIPAWLDAEDIRQELLVEAWRALKRYDPVKAKGQTPAQFTEFAAKYLLKGREVSIQGRISNRSWEDDEGNKKYISEVVADTVTVDVTVKLFVADVVPLVCVGIRVFS